VVRLSAAELEYQLAIRGWDQRILARQAGVSEATVSRAMAGGRVRGMSGLRIAQALRRTAPVSELVVLVRIPEGGARGSNIGR
jgi:DNA-binding transcriptional regulator LsrR (DeoR family)